MPPLFSTVTATADGCLGILGRGIVFALPAQNLTVPRYQGIASLALCGPCISERSTCVLLGTRDVAIFKKRQPRKLAISGRKLDCLRGLSNEYSSQRAEMIPYPANSRRLAARISECHPACTPTIS